MSWKQNIQLRDLEAGQKIEMTCKRCGHVHFVTAEKLLVDPNYDFKYLDEVEAMTICHARICRGQVRLALVRNDNASGFVGGLA